MVAIELPINLYASLISQVTFTFSLSFQALFDISSIVDCFYFNVLVYEQGLSSACDIASKVLSFVL